MADYHADGSTLACHARKEVTPHLSRNVSNANCIHKQQLRETQKRLFLIFTGVA